MSEKLCTLRTRGGGGGGSATWVETILWANPSPTSAFAAQTVTLSDDINNYDYLKVSYINYNGATALNDPFSVLIPVSDFKTSLAANSTRHNVFTYGGMYAPTNNSWTRFMFYNTDTTAKFSAVYQVGGTGSGKDNAVPLQIVGISKGRVPSYKTVKDFIHAKVFDSGLPEIATWTTTNRATITKGKVVADAVARKVYLYFDFTMTTTQSTTESWNTIVTFTSAIQSYLPIYTANNRQTNVSLITDDSSDVPTARFAFGYGTSNYTYRFYSAYGTTYNIGDHYIVYTEYTY